MNLNRLDQLKAMLAAEPEDAFLQYAVAQEYISQGNFATAKDYLTRLSEARPDYVPTWYHLGLCLVQLGEVEAAISVLQKGVGIATEAGDRKTAAEIAELLDDLED